MRWGTYAALIAVILLCLFPAWSVWRASDLAGAHGCVVNEAAPVPCIVDGVDISETLHAAFVSGWFLLLSLPVAAVTAIVLAVLIVRDLLARRRH